MAIETCVLLKCWFTHSKPSFMLTELNPVLRKMAEGILAVLINTLMTALCLGLGLESQTKRK